MAPCQDATVANDGADTVMLVANGRSVREQRLEVVADGKNVLVAGVVEVHQLADTHAVLCEGEVAGNVNIVEDVFPVKKGEKYFNWMTITNCSIKEKSYFYPFWILKHN